MKSNHSRIAVLSIFFFGLISTAAIADKTVRYYGPGEAPSAEDIASMLGISKSADSSNSQTRGRLGKRKSYSDDAYDQPSSNDSSTQTPTPAKLAIPEQSGGMDHPQSRKMSVPASQHANVELAMAIEFALNSYSIEKISLEALDKLCSGIASGQASILIEGHTDASGSYDHNLSLSTKRAEAVKAYLVRKGINPGRLITRGVAATKPLFTDDQFAAKNRRVQFSRID